MPPASRRAQQRRRRQIVGTVVLSITALAVAAGIVGWQLTRPPPPDDRTMCPAAGPTAQVVLLVDATDPLTFTQHEAFQALMREVVEKRVPTGGLLSVFVLGPDFHADAAPLVELCNPGTGADRSALTANLARLRARYEDRFLKPLLAASDRLVATAPAPTSPLFEMIQLVGINGFRRHDVKGPRRLVVLSDMLQNTAGYSMYRQPMDFDAYAATDYGRRSLAELPGVDVELHVLMDTPRLQTRRQVQFWEQWFDRAGARLVSVQPLEG